jgi:hypothetical protein
MEVPALREYEHLGLVYKTKVIPSGSIKALDELLDLPHLYVLLRNVLTHLGRRSMHFLEVPAIRSR